MDGGGIGQQSWVNGIQWSVNQNGGDGMGMVSHFWKKWQL
jgi:hypothetical protein